MNDYLVGEACQLQREALHAFDQERGVREPLSLRTPGAAREGIGTGVDRDREGAGLGTRAVQYVATVTRAHVHEDVAERGGYCGDLTDVDVDELFTGKAAHLWILAAHDHAIGVSFTAVPPPAGAMVVAARPLGTDPAGRV